MPRQFRLRSLFILTAIVAVGCLVGPPIVCEVAIVLYPPDPTLDVWQAIQNGPRGNCVPHSLLEDLYPCPGSSTTTQEPDTT